MNTQEIDDTRILTNGNLCKISYDEITKACNGEHYTMTLKGSDATVAIKAVNHGIDSRLQACYVFQRGDLYQFDTEQQWLNCSVSPESLPVFLRRLFDDMEWCDNENCTGEDCDGSIGYSLAEGILQTLGFDDCGRYVGRDD